MHERLSLWQVVNPAIYLISILPAVMVFALVQLEQKQIVLLLATMAVILLQHAINLFNDVSDWILGADEEKANSWVRFFGGNTVTVNRHALISLFLGGVLGLGLLLWQDKLWIVFFALPLIVLGYFYNAGSSPLSYSRLGEWVTGICYGGVFAGYWLLTGQGVTLIMILGVSATGALAMSLLLSHQPPQIETDRQVGKLSFCVRYGVTRTEHVSVWLFGVASFLVLLAYWIETQRMLASFFFLFLLSVSVFFMHKRKPNPPRVLVTTSAFLALLLI